MNRYVVANWKSNKTLAESRHWLNRFLELHRPLPALKVIIAPAFPFLFPLHQMLVESKSDVRLASQDISSFPGGAYTGSVAAAMLREVVDFALVGHSERRRWFHETNQDVANKVAEARDVGITPIVCIDQPYARTQLAALADHDLGAIIIGYGPVEAVGVDVSPSPQRIVEAISEIKVLAPDSPILYGGSVNGKNAKEYMKIAGISGLMVATASLDPEDFVDICQQISEE
ncbi:MAG: triose-phosphate isomerase family protein [Thermodesulfobacteriota bacterium]